MSLCKRHPGYKGLRPSVCPRCKPTYYWRKVRKFFGLTVAEAKPRTLKDYGNITLNGEEK